MFEMFKKNTNNWKDKTKVTAPDGIELGDLVRDKITGFTGIVECISEWLNNCRRITVKSQALKDGVPQDNHTFDAPQIVVLKKGYFDNISEAEKTGGPEIKPARASDPT